MWGSVKVRDMAPLSINFSEEAFGQKAVGFREGGGDNVREGLGNARSQGVGGR